MTDTYSAVREGAAFIDHRDEGRFEIAGPDATVFVNMLITKDIETLEELRTVQALFLDHDGGVVAIAWVMVDRDRFIVLTEPADRDPLARHMETCRAASSGLDVTVTDLRESMDSLALMGPLAQKLAAEAVHEDVVGLSFLSFDQYDEVDALVIRVGYVGEYEYRILVPHGDTRVVQRLREAGPAFSLADADPAALAPLMLEMRQLARSRDLVGVNPVEAGLHEMIDFRKEAFIGRDAVLAMKETMQRRLMTLVVDGRQVEGLAEPVRIDGTEVGRVVSSGYSAGMGATLIHAIVDAEVAGIGVTYDLDDGTGAVLAAEARSAPLLITRTIRGVT